MMTISDREGLVAQKSLALALAVLAAFAASGPATPVPKTPPTKLAILHAPPSRDPDADAIADWVLLDADGKNPRPFRRPDGTRETVTVLPGQRPVVVKSVPGESFTLLHPDGRDIRVSLTDGVLRDVWRALRWQDAQHAVAVALYPGADDDAKEAAVDAVAVALGPLTDDQLKSFNRTLTPRSLSPDGNRVAFSSCFGPPRPFVVLDIRASRASNFTRGLRPPAGSEIDGVEISPDFEWLAYRTWNDPSVSSETAVYVARTGGTHQTRIAEETSAGWKTIRDLGSEAWLRPLIGETFAGEFAEKQRADDVTFSPDNAVAILERPGTDDTPQFFVHDRRTKRELRLPQRRVSWRIDAFRWVRVPADRD